MNEIIEALFERFLNTPPTGELAEAMHTISAAIDAQIEAGAVGCDTIGDYELAASRYGFYAGFAAGVKFGLAAKHQRAAQRAAQ